MKMTDVELAGEQALRKVERGVIVFERHLAHRGRDDRDAAAAFDHRRDFGRHPALEGDDAKSAEAGSEVRGIGLRVWVHRERPRRIVNLAAREIRREEQVTSSNVKPAWVSRFLGQG